MMRAPAIVAAAVLIAAGAPGPAAAPSQLGLAEGQCRTREAGPAVLVAVDGLKDRKGLVRLELYAAVDGEFLADDRDLAAAGKTFRRVEVPVPAEGPVELCIRAPHAGAYALTVIHDRDMVRKFKLSIDGVGFSNNPKLGWSPPKADAARIEVGAGLTRIAIRMNYRRGLLAFGPVAE